jgi:hypothetical protein
LLLFDPLAVSDALLALTRERQPVIVLAAPSHERDTRALVERFDAAVFAPTPDSARDLIDKCGITAKQASDGGLTATASRRRRYHPLVPGWRSAPVRDRGVLRPREQRRRAAHDTRLPPWLACKSPGV